MTRQEKEELLNNINELMKNLDTIEEISETAETPSEKKGLLLACLLIKARIETIKSLIK